MTSTHQDFYRAALIARTHPLTTDAILGQYQTYACILYKALCNYERNDCRSMTSWDDLRPWFKNHWVNQIRKYVTLQNSYADVWEALYDVSLYRSWFIREILDLSVPARRFFRELVDQSAGSVKDPNYDWCLPPISVHRMLVQLQQEGTLTS